MTICTYDNPWLHNGTAVTDDDAVGRVGFVYMITNLTNNRKYIGKKKLWTTKTRTVKKKKKREKVLSDWKNYYGSSKELQEDVERLGTSKFKREVLYFCTTLGEMSYIEAREQFLREVLLCDEYYNQFIGAKIHAKHLPKEIKKC